MAATNLTSEDREAIYEVLYEYVWCMDIGDIDGLVRCFTPDAEVKDFTGHRWAAPEGPRHFAEHFINRPDRPAMQALEPANAAGGCTRRRRTCHLLLDDDPGQPG